MHAIWAKWAPPPERSILTTITYAGDPRHPSFRPLPPKIYILSLQLCSCTGPHIGSILSFPLSALLCQYGFDGGWPSVFYVFGEKINNI